MALIQVGSLISNIKGSVGGTTFSNNRAGTVAKKRLVGKRLPNTKQASALNQSVATTVAWNALTSAQQTVFNDYALANVYTSRYGQVKVLTGYQWYKQLSQSSFYFTGTQLTVPPTYSIPSALPTFSVLLGSDTISVEWSIPIDTSDIFIYVYATPFVRSQARVQRGAYRLLDMTGVDVSSSFQITLAWNNAFGLPYYPSVIGARVNISVLIFAVKKSSFNSGIAQTAFGSNF